MADVVMGDALGGYSLSMDLGVGATVARELAEGVERQADDAFRAAQGVYGIRGSIMKKYMVV